MKRLKVILMAGVLALGAGPARAGLQIDVEIVYPEPEVRQRVGVILIQPDKVALEMKANTWGRRETIVYDGVLKHLVNLQHGKKTYRIMTRKKMEAIAKSMDEMVADMEKQLEQLPESRRKRLREIIQAKKDAAAPAKVEVDKTDEETTIQGVSCRKYLIKESGETVGEVWAGAWEDVGIDRDEFMAFYTFAEFQRDLVVLLPKGRDKARGASAYKSIDGFPVRINIIEEGRVTRQTTLSRIQKKKIDALRFLPPKGYKEERIAGF